MSADPHAGDGGQTGQNRHPKKGDRRARDGEQSAHIKKADPGPDCRAIRTIRTPKKGDSHTDLRDRLTAMRAELVETMIATGFSAGLGALLAQIGAGLDALDKLQGSPPKHAGGGSSPSSSSGDSAHYASSARTVLADDGETVRLTIYSGAETLGEAELDVPRTVALAADLLLAARRLARTFP